MIRIYFYQTDIGKIGIVDNDSMITHLFFETDDYSEQYIIEETPLLRRAHLQLQEYFKGQRKEFDLPLNPIGSPFMELVWKSLQEIPYGETRSYKDISIRIGKDMAFRAVGYANNKNPLPIFIPCHRVIGANGKLVGYGGGLKIKLHLLELEKKY